MVWFDVECAPVRCARPAPGPATHYTRGLAACEAAAAYLVPFACPLPGRMRRAACTQSDAVTGCREATASTRSAAGALTAKTLKLCTRAA